MKRVSTFEGARCSTRPTGTRTTSRLGRGPTGLFLGESRELTAAQPVRDRHAGGILPKHSIGEQCRGETCQRVHPGRAERRRAGAARAVQEGAEVDRVIGGRQHPDPVGDRMPRLCAEWALRRVAHALAANVSLQPRSSVLGTRPRISKYRPPMPVSSGSAPRITPRSSVSKE